MLAELTVDNVPFNNTVFPHCWCVHTPYTHLVLAVYTCIVLAVVWLLHSFSTPVEGELVTKT